MDKTIMALIAAAAAFTAAAAEPAARATVTVDPAKARGPIRLMNGVNNGPSVSKPAGDQKRGNFIYYKAARFPFARLHDSVNCCPGGAHSVDVNAIFRDFDADETRQENYDFVSTDHYLDAIRRAGTAIYYRLGQTIEHGPKKYGALPPKDFAKWARICERIIRHYNEGWAWGVDRGYTTSNIAWSNQFNIAYWEIWNEPDLDASDGELPRNPRCWGGTVTNFFDFYVTAAKHLKGKFPKLKIGGPALCGNEGFAKRFLRYCRDRQAPLDFFSWHIYSRTPEPVAAKCDRMRKLLDDEGFAGCESILNEWNYVKGWTDDWVYSLRVESGDLQMKGAAYIAAVMATCQSHPLDKLMFYDARLGSSMNNLFNVTTYWPMKGYYPFIAWLRLLDLGTQVDCEVAAGLGEASDANTGNVERKDRASSGQFYAVAAKGSGGRGAVFVVRYSDDDNSSDIAEVKLRVKGGSLAGAVCHMTDLVRTHTWMPVEADADGTLTMLMHPLSFALVEY